MFQTRCSFYQVRRVELNFGPKNILKVILATQRIKEVTIILELVVQREMSCRLQTFETQKSDVNKLIDVNRLKPSHATLQNRFHVAMCLLSNI